MSVDGRTAPVLSSVRQLVDASPTRCLVRKVISVMSTDDVHRGDGSRSRRLVPGDVLTLVEVTGQRLLRCRDEMGSDVFLPLSQRGLFSAVNARTAASVYTLRSLLAEFRLPIAVRLVCGSLPTRDVTTTDLRLAGIHTDRITFVLPLRHVWESAKIDRHALVAVPSKYARRLRVMAATRDFYYHWVMSDDGLEQTERCSELIASWKTSVHIVSSSIATAAAAAAASAVTSRGYEGDDETWSRGPLKGSSDSGLSSSTSSPSFFPDDDDSAGAVQLEEEIDDIYARIRHNGDGGLARQGRARSLDEMYSQRPTLAVYSGRRPSVDVLCASQVPVVAVTTRPTRLKRNSKFVDVALPPSAVATSRQFSCTGNVKLLGVTVRLEAEADNIDRDAVVDRQTAGSISAYPLRSRSTSLPEVTVVRQEEPVAAKPHKSIIGTISRSIAKAFRRMRPHKASHTYTIDTGLTTFASERYSKKTCDCDVDVDDNRTELY